MRAWLLGILLACTLGGLVADTFYKKWSISGAGWLLVTGTFIYSLDALLWAYGLRRGLPLVKMSVLYGVLTALVGVAVGLWFGEALTPKIMIGILLGIGSLVFLGI